MSDFPLLKPLHDVSSEPSVSIAMTTYNGESYLEEQLYSILKQDYPVAEIVICDDASTDQTKAILQSFSSKLITVHCNTSNLGYVKNFQQAMQMCSGDYIALCDQDDIWLPNKISTQVDLMQQNKLSAVFSDATLIDDHGDEIDVGLWASLGLENRLAKGIDFRAFYLSNCVTGCTLMVTKELVNIACPFPDSVPHDWWLAYHAAHQNSLAFSKKKLVAYRQHSNNVIGVSGMGQKKWFEMDWKRWLGTLSLRLKLRKLVTGMRGTQKRLRAMLAHEATSNTGPSKELQYLNSWIDDRLDSKDLDQYRPFFKSGGATFQFFHPADRYCRGLDECKRRVANRVLLRYFIIFLLAGSLAAAFI